MKFNYWIAEVILAVGLLVSPVNSQTQTDYFARLNQTPKFLAQQPPNVPLSNQERQELLRLRQEKEIRDRVREEVDRAFGHATFSLRMLLLVTILVPVLSGMGFWLFYRHLINQITSENKTRSNQETSPLLPPENYQEFANQTALFKEEIERLKIEFGEQLNQIIQPVNYPLTYQDYQPNLTDSLTEETANQIGSATIEESSPLPAENEELASINHRQALTVEEHFNLGNHHFAEGRYAEANQCYNDAVKIERNFPEARYQNARAYALRGSINPAIGNLQWAIDLDPKYKEIAKADSAFTHIRTDEQFKKVIEE